MRGFFRELKERRVYRVALAYVVVASGLVQIGGTILPIFHAAEWVQQLFVVLIAVGFPFALVLAWAFDITSEGIQRTANVSGLHVTSGARSGSWRWSARPSRPSPCWVTGSGIRGAQCPRA